MSGWNYFYQGLFVRSEIHLPEWSLFEQATFPVFAENAVQIHRDSADEEPAHEDGEYRVNARQAGVFIVRGGREIRFVPAPDAGIARVRALLIGWIWGALLYQREAILLHASAVRVGNSAVAFCARRGGGKSTLAASLSTRDFALLNDDLSCVKHECSSAPSVYPSIPRLKLCEDAMQRLGWDASVENRDHLQAGKYHYFSKNEGATSAVTLRRIYLLAWGDPEIRRVRGLTAFTRLTSAATWRPALLEAAGNPSAHFGRYARLLRDVECWEFRRSHDLSRFDSDIEVLTKHLSDLKAV
jgi:hypothetical protein